MMRTRKTRKDFFQLVSFSRHLVILRCYSDFFAD